MYLPKAPPISAPFVGIFTFTIPQSEPNGLPRRKIQYTMGKFEYCSHTLAPPLLTTYLLTPPLLTPPLLTPPLLTPPLLTPPLLIPPLLTPPLLTPPLLTPPLLTSPLPLTPHLLTSLFFILDLTSPDL